MLRTINELGDHLDGAGYDVVDAKTVGAEEGWWASIQHAVDDEIAASYADRPAYPTWDHDRRRMNYLVAAGVVTGGYLIARSPRHTGRQV